MFNIVKNKELLVARLRKEASYFVSDFVGAGRRKIQPFVVICRQRTGSNMLRYALETHPQVVHYGELFHEARKKIWGAYGKYFYQPQKLVDWRRADARSFLDRVIYRDTSPPIRAVGFKLFYSHGRVDGKGNPWPVIRERDDVKIIHLVRENPIASFLSNEQIQRAEPYVQMRTTSSRGDRGDDAASERLVLDVEKFKAYLIGYENDIRKLGEEFPDREILELSYEALSSPQAVDSVLDFLGVERRPLRFQTVRQSKGDVSKKIANLDEVAAAQRGTRWDRVPEQ